MTEYLKCKKCGFLNELVLNWRHLGDPDDTHYITCIGCKDANSINNQDRTSMRLYEGRCGLCEKPVQSYARKYKKYLAGTYKYLCDACIEIILDTYSN